MSTFDEMLKKGQEIEKEAQKRICQKFDTDIFHVQTSDNYKEVHYDFMTADWTKYEVKADFASDKTNNIFIEFSGYGKPSGICITEAHYHIIYSKGIYHMIGTPELKDLIKGCKIAVTRRTQTYGYLLPYAKVYEVSLII